MQNKIDISIVILTYNVKYFLENTLHSIYNSKTKYTYELIIVDNYSSDGSKEHIVHLFPQVNYIFNSWNAGFAKGNNIGLKKAKGDFILVLNPDTHLNENTLEAITDYIKSDNDCDMCSCKLVTPDGNLDNNSHRNFPSAWNSFSHISGLAKLFPNSKFFSSYLMTYLPIDSIAKVEAISGSFMFFKRKIIDEGFFIPEEYFMYGEDLDFCYQITKSGYKIKYVPITEVIHYKGQSSKKDKIKIRRYFFEAMSIFVEKNYSKKYSSFFRFFIKMAVFFAYLGSIASITIKKFFSPLMDILSYFISLLIALFFYKPVLNLMLPEYAMKLTNLSLNDYYLPTAIYLLLQNFYFYIFKIYGNNKSNKIKFINVSINYVATAVALTYFVKSFAHSRLILLFLLIFHITLMLSWRIFILPRLKMFKENTLIIGIDKTSKQLLTHKKAIYKSGLDIKGYLDLGKNHLGKNVNGMPVFGDISNLQDIVKQELIDCVIFSLESTAFHLVEKYKTKLDSINVSYKCLPDFIEVKRGKIKFIEFKEA